MYLVFTDVAAEISSADDSDDSEHGAASTETAAADVGVDATKTDTTAGDPPPEFSPD